MGNYITIDEKKELAMQTLVDLGILINANDVQLFHGRANFSNIPFRVDPNFNNAGNNTGNMNVNSVSTLYTLADSSIANEFAVARSRDTDGTPEVHRILPLKKHAYFLRSDALNLAQDKSTKEEVLNCLKNLNYNDNTNLIFNSITSLRPIPIKFKDDMPEALNTVQSYIDEKIKEEKKNNPDAKALLTRVLNSNEIENLKLEMKNKYSYLNNDLNMFIKVFDYYCRAYNTQILLQNTPRMFSHEYRKSNQSVNINGAPININLKYLKEFYKSLNIIGSYGSVSSATLHGKNIFVYSIFDLESVGTQKQRQELDKKIYSMKELLNTLELDKLNINKRKFEFLKHSNGKESILFFHTGNEKLKELYNKSCHIREDWNIGQHTAGVINAFNKYYKDDFPEDMLPFIKILLSAHDIGKWYAKENGVPQNLANAHFSKPLFDSLNIEEKYRELFVFLFTDCQDFTTTYHLCNNVDKSKLLENISNKCDNMLNKNFENYNHLNPYDKQNIIQSVIMVGDCLQHCDSLSYTSYSNVPQIFDEDDLSTNKFENESQYYVSGNNENFKKSFNPDENDRNTPKLINEIDFD